MLPNEEVCFAALENAKALAWDGCHKIYVLMDDETVKEMEGFGYEPYYIDDTTFAQLTLEDMWDASCSLRFITELSMGAGGTQYKDLVPQDLYRIGGVVR